MKTLWTKNNAGIVTILLIIALVAISLGCKQQKGSDDVNLLVVTGGHDYDTVEFEQMFAALPGISYEMALKPDAWKMLADGKDFDVIAFYDMWKDISEEEKQIFLDEFEKGTGIVFLHHSLASHPEWPEYMQLVGGKYNEAEYTPDTSQRSDYKHDIVLQVRVLDKSHPVTEGVGDFEILDEGYSNTLQLPGVHNLLETSHPDCDRYIGWTHAVKNAKVVYLMGGHDKHAYEHPSFRKLLSNAINYTKP
jgi:type 1 glutamine amidotransferase